ncbi:MAG: nucleotidyl transferase AbiEii/AbiGii toxin family protein [Kyrpidia sp.]|nr:nucleotidyl transferase AbiEii/AbiGii toxin family protein [Kyrpidia sp.]
MYWDRIDLKTGETLKELRKTGLFRSFYLSGGTALALQLGHRVSEDLDFFTKNANNKLNAQAVMNRLEQHFGGNDYFLPRLFCNNWSIRKT